MSDTAALTANEKAGTVETRAEYEKNPGEFTKYWLKAIELASDEEKDWRAQAKETIDRYKANKARSFNILYANTQTTVPALYNSEPVPDVRRRFGDDDEAGQTLAEIIERAISIQAEMYDFDSTMKAAVKDRQLPGRGVSRVRLMMGENGSKWLKWEPVSYRDFRRGPAKTWDDVPWVAYRHRLKRDELVALNPKIGEQVGLDASVGEAPKKDDDKLADTFKRATVWEVWDREARKVYFLAESHPLAPLKVEDDPYKLRQFWPSPRPLYQVEVPDTLVPVCEFQIWKSLADEVDDITKRIAGIVKVMKWRGLYAGQFENIMAKLSGLDDGELAAADDSARAMQEGGIDKAIWLWPIEQAIQTVQGLYEAREQAKAHLYELTGVADILRGQTNAQETLGAQQIKAQWGSLRLQDGQKDVQRYARDCFRISADMLGLFEPAQLEAMTGLSFRPEMPEGTPPEMQQQAMMVAEQQAQKSIALLQSDLQREFAIEIETDSTIRADLSRAQQNIAGFVQGFGTFIQSVGPAVQAGMMPPEAAVKLLTSFARAFKLGREAETVLDEWEQHLQDKAKQPPPPNPEQQKAQLEIQAKQQDMQMKGAQQQADLQAKQQEQQMNLQMKQAELELKRQELELQRQKMELEAQHAQHAHAAKMQAMQEEARFASEARAADAQHEDARRGAELQFIQQKQAMRPPVGAA